MSDVTARYASDWCTATRRLRLSESWWKETLEPYALSKEERELEEEDIMSKLNTNTVWYIINLCYQQLNSMYMYIQDNWPFVLAWIVGLGLGPIGIETEESVHICEVSSSLRVSN